MTRELEKTLPTSQIVSALLDQSTRAGSNVSFSLAEGTVNVVLDQSGDWTIMVGVSTGSERFSTLTFSLERLGFFRATENDGVLYFLWTSAMEESGGVREILETKLVDVLRTIHTTRDSIYIR